MNPKALFTTALWALCLCLPAESEVLLSNLQGKPTKEFSPFLSAKGKGIDFGIEGKRPFQMTSVMLRLKLSPDSQPVLWIVEADGEEWAKLRLAKDTKISEDPTNYVFETTEPFRVWPDRIYRLALMAKKAPDEMIWLAGPAPKGLPEAKHLGQTYGSGDPRFWKNASTLVNLFEIRGEWGAVQERPSKSAGSNVLLSNRGPLQPHRTRPISNKSGIGLDVRIDGEKAIRIDSVEIEIEADTKAKPTLLLLGTPESWSNEHYPINRAVGLTVGGPRTVRFEFSEIERKGGDETTVVTFAPNPELGELVLPPGTWRFAIASDVTTKLILTSRPRPNTELGVSLLRNPTGNPKAPESWKFGHFYTDKTIYTPPRFQIKGAAVELDSTQYEAEKKEHADVQEFSGIHPHLAFFNDVYNGECGVGAVVNWAGDLWTVTYGPNHHTGSIDRLFRIDGDRQIYTHVETAGGTPANRMIHEETGQMIIGNHVIDKEGGVRTISPFEMPGRITGNARHLTDPENKVYYATMEEGFYEVNMHTLEVTTIHRDRGNHSNGNHGKGLYLGQGRVVYSNNGGGRYGLKSGNELSFRFNQDFPQSGSLNEWDGKKWTQVHQAGFLDVTGPGGIRGNPNPDIDPLWSIGWDYRSVILKVLDAGQWHTYRLPKASHTMDGPNGFNTEWPRIGEIGDPDERLIYTHGMFWKMPNAFSSTTAGGIRPRSTYLKMVSDSTRWRDQIVLACNEVANDSQAYTLNRRAVRGMLYPTISHGSLWFLDPDGLDQQGVPVGKGSVWSSDDVAADAPSDAYQFGGWDQRILHLSHQSEHAVSFVLELDRDGDGQWREHTAHIVKPKQNHVIGLSDAPEAEWVRLIAKQDAKGVVAAFHYSKADDRPAESSALFEGIATPEDDNVVGGLVRMRGNQQAPLSVVGTDGSYYEMGADMKLVSVDAPEMVDFVRKNTAIPDLEKVGLTADKASVLYVEQPAKGATARYRLPRGSRAFDEPSVLGEERADRSLVRERTIFNCHGIFYELPFRNAGGFRLIRPVTTHNRRIKDYGPWRGLMVISGVDRDTENRHIIRSEDGEAGVWVGTIDDLWKFGKVRGFGGPWYDSEVKAGEPSDRYLMNGFDRKTMTLSHQSNEAVEISIEVDVTGYGDWRLYQTFSVPPGKELQHAFARDFSAYWVRAVAGADTIATAQFVYE